MKSESPTTCSGPACGCAKERTSPAWHRREFLKTLGLGAGIIGLQPWQAMAGPFTRPDFDKLVPADKKLSPDWLKSLTERGERTVYRGAALQNIGMPVGGICAGQLYLGGDGRLWHWDIFNQHTGTGAEHYAKPMKSNSPVEQGFAIRILAGGKTWERTLDAEHWPDVSFIGEYPIGYVQYTDSDCPVSLKLEAFSPFIPLNTEDSSLPATVLEFTVTNQGSTPAEVELAGWLENAVCSISGKARVGLRRNRLVKAAGGLFLECSAEEVPQTENQSKPDLVFESFERPDYGRWVSTGTAFGTGPVEIAKIPSYQGDVGGKGNRVVNTHASAPGRTVEERDSATGTLTSAPFTIERNYIHFLIGGGAHKNKTCLNLLIGDEVVLSATGHDNNHMEPASWSVQPWLGKIAHFQIVDNESGPWGNIGVDEMVFSDRPGQSSGPLSAEKDFGTLVLALLKPANSDVGQTAQSGTLPGSVFVRLAGGNAPATRSFHERLIGSLTRKMKLKRGGTAKATFVLSWHMPNLNLNRLPPKRYYATRFDSAKAVAEYVLLNYTRLSAQTRLWHDTWYDSTLPYWFLDRTFLNTSILATSTCFRFGNGRFYGWEGVGCCEGTCGHVWQYAHAMARLFPELERITREKVDFGLALQPDGAIHFRGEFNDIPAIDAQSGTILRALREHQMSTDDQFLKRNWAGIKRAMEWLIAKDGNGDGLIEGNQHNTLDTDWFGPVAWLSGIYLAALRAAEQMALEVGDQEFARKCQALFEVGHRHFVAELYDGEYFRNRPDPSHLDAINSGSGCEIDQVLGQSWAFQVGLPRVLPREETLSALKSVWRYNFTPDVGPYREAYKQGRWYAMPGEAGLLMCSFPRSDWDYAQAKGKGPDWAAGYFNECMNGFEYQAAGHMIWEGLITEGLAITRAVHDRYHGSRRNPWNEIECGDHYARSMASYGVFLAACGYEYDGPRGRLGFAPRWLSPAKSFKAAFTAAEGWGTYSQATLDSQLDFEILPTWGKLRLNTFTLQLPEGRDVKSVRVSLNGRDLQSTFKQEETRLMITLPSVTEVTAGQPLRAVLT